MSDRRLGEGQVDDGAFEARMKSTVTAEAHTRFELGADGCGFDMEANQETKGGGLKEHYIEEDKDGDLFYEIYCRGPQKCGAFVSSTKLKHCPKCRSPKIILRTVRKKLDFPQRLYRPWTIPSSDQR